MNGIADFDWDALELQDKKRRGILKEKDFHKLGYSQDIIEAYEATFHKIENPPRTGSIVEGQITKITSGQAIIDIGYMEDVYLDVDKEDKRYLDYIQEGLDIKIRIVSGREEKGYYNGSFTAAAKEIKRREILDSVGDKSVAYTGHVKELVAGGYIVLIDDIETFMPGSLAGINKLHDFESLLGQELNVKAVNFERGNIVVSHREYLRALIPGEIEIIRQDLSRQRTGHVTGTTKYGVFCEFNECLTGMILLSDLNDDMRKAHSEGKIKPGQEIDFYVKEVVSNKKIVLSQSLKYDPWSDITERYNPLPYKKEGLISSIKEYGMFIKLEDEVVGLLHQSEINDKTYKEGDIIDVIINRIEPSTKKVFLSLP